jgi:hypothetical protein
LGRCGPGNAYDIIVDRHLELKLAAPGSQPYLGFDDARELERVPFDLRGLQEKRRAEAREIIAPSVPISVRQPPG